MQQAFNNTLMRNASLSENSELFDSLLSGSREHYSIPAAAFTNYNVKRGLRNPDGTGVMVPTVITGVRAGGHEEEGLEFVQSLLSPELQLSINYYAGGNGYDQGYPVFWEHAETLIEQKEIFNLQECAVVNNYEETITNLRTVIIDEYLFEQTLLAAQSCYRTEDRLTPEEAADALIDATRIYLAELR